MAENGRHRLFLGYEVIIAKKAPPVKGTPVRLSVITLRQSLSSGFAFATFGGLGLGHGQLEGFENVSVASSSDAADYVVVAKVGNRCLDCFGINANNFTHT